MSLLQGGNARGDEVERDVPTYRFELAVRAPQQRPEHALRMIEQGSRGEAFDAHLAAVDGEILVCFHLQVFTLGRARGHVHPALKRTIRAVRLDRTRGSRKGQHSRQGVG